MYSRLIQNKERFFGVSGLLYRSNVLMYDRGTESLWSQIKGEAVTGELSGTRLEILPSSLTTWGNWRRAHPETLVLSTDTGFVRDYTTDPYRDYYRKKSGFWSFFTPAAGEKEKELVVGVERNGKTRAWPLELLRQRGEIEDQLAGSGLRLKFDAASDRLQVVDSAGDSVPHMIAYWFVWKGIHPQTERYKPH